MTDVETRPMDLAAIVAASAKDIAAVAGHMNAVEGRLEAIEHHTPCLRDRFAMAALPGCLHGEATAAGVINITETVRRKAAVAAYAIADEMLAQRG